ncbi:DEAD/DEAH box helicase [Butyrivibrio sp. MC2013]|uniref:DEAD/DEAH box helicase n=1 Tax=Butyrivibrio sp. MC2013 TaxID=1280686 RepID=UPI0004115481|nr:DEAD/DEAH box helicase [Butyrivibrio sp. MC2013]
MSDILEDLELFSTTDGSFRHKEENTYQEMERKRGQRKKKAFGVKDSFRAGKKFRFDSDKRDADDIADHFGKRSDDKNENSVEEKPEEEIMEETISMVEDIASDIGDTPDGDDNDYDEENAGDDKEDDRIRYEDSGLDERILRAVKEMGFEYMSPIQKAAIPVMMKGGDIIGQAQTGTGKTAAFGIPTLCSVDPADKHLQAVILCPTRELAMQAADDIRDFAKYMHGIKVLPVYGGQDITRQIRALSSGVQIVVGTPGRVMDHMRRRTMKMETVKTLVLDEADEMLDMGFREDIETILKEMPVERQTALFSATMPEPILNITRQYQKPDATHIKLSTGDITVKAIEQSYYVIPRELKFEVLTRLIDYYQPRRSLIFANTKRMVDELAKLLSDKGYPADGLHGDLSQNQRDLVMSAFRNGRISILIATDVAARGIDVSGVDCVFNFDIPEDIEYYVHRIGRTGRAGKSGKSCTLVSGREVWKIRDIERICHTSIEEKKVPTAKEITRAKSQKIFAEVVDVIENGNIEAALEFVGKKIEEGEYSAEQLAAGFMRLKMGDEVKDLDIPERRRGRNGRGSFDGRRNGRDGHGRGRGDDRRYARGGRRDDQRGRSGRSFDGKKNGRDRDGFKSARGESRRDGRGGYRRDGSTAGGRDSFNSSRTGRGRDSYRDHRDQGNRKKDSHREAPRRLYGSINIKTRGADGKFHED